MGRIMSKAYAQKKRADKTSEKVSGAVAIRMNRVHDRVSASAIRSPRQVNETTGRKKTTSSNSKGVKRRRTV